MCHFVKIFSNFIELFTKTLANIYKYARLWGSRNELKIQVEKSIDNFSL